MEQTNLPDQYKLEYPLLTLNDQDEALTLDDFVRGCFICGSTGSGKSSGSGKTIAKSLLAAGYGGLVLTGKPDEKENWVKYAKECGRLDDLIIFDETARFRFNPLSYELNRTDRGGGLTKNIALLFVHIYELSNKQSGSGKQEERFWISALERLLHRLIDLIRLTETEELTIENMYKIVSSMPDSPEQWSNEEFLNDSYCVYCLTKAYEHNKDAKEFALVDNYFSKEMPMLDSRTRSNVLESYLGLAEPFMLSGVLKELFSTTTNITPEITHNGQILVIDLPPQEYLQTGIYAQNIWKYMWQNVIQRRDITKSPCPNFLWMDESQLFLSNQDWVHQTTARASRVITIMATQNISNFYSAIGGQRFKEQTDSLLANLAIKIFHSNQDAVTNNWAAEIIGKDFTIKMNFHSNATSAQGSSGGSQQLHHQILPLYFTQLRTGGISHGLKVEAYMSVAGRVWNSNGGKNWLKLEFDQRV